MSALTPTAIARRPPGATGRQRVVIAATAPEFTATLAVPAIPPAIPIGARRRLFLGDVHHAEIVLRVLKEVLGRHPVAARRRVASKGQVLVVNLYCGALQFYARAVAFEAAIRAALRESAFIGVRSARAATPRIRTLSHTLVSHVVQDTADATIASTSLEATAGRAVFCCFVRAVGGMLLAC